LYGKVVIVGLEVVETKGNLGATEVKKLIKEHKDKTKEEKANMLDNLKKYLTNIDKISQKRCSSAFELLEKEWN
jgi:glutamate synthase domain-containing protein 3